MCFQLFHCPVAQISSRNHPSHFQIFLHDVLDTRFGNIENSGHFSAGKTVVFHWKCSYCIHIYERRGCGLPPYGINLVSDLSSLNCAYHRNIIPEFSTLAPKFFFHYSRANSKTMLPLVGFFSIQDCPLFKLKISQIKFQRGKLIILRTICCEPCCLHPRILKFKYLESTQRLYRVRKKFLVDNE